MSSNLSYPVSYGSYGHSSDDDEVLPYLTPSNMNIVYYLTHGPHQQSCGDKMNGVHKKKRTLLSPCHMGLLFFWLYRTSTVIINCSQMQHEGM